MACIPSPFGGDACVEADSDFGSAVYYARGMNGGSHLTGALGYEFDSQILYQLNYGVTYRRTAIRRSREIVAFLYPPPDLNVHKYAIVSTVIITVVAQAMML